MAVELGQILAQVTQVKETINAAEKVILGNVFFKVKRVEKALLLIRLKPNNIKAPSSIRHAKL
jgi:hypothetical protein